MTIGRSDVAGVLLAGGQARRMGGGGPRGGNPHRLQPGDIVEVLLVQVGKIRGVAQAPLPASGVRATIEHAAMPVQIQLVFAHSSWLAGHRGETKLIIRKSRAGQSSQIGSYGCIVRRSCRRPAPANRDCQGSDQERTDSFPG